jgi:hypothetical protein
MGAPDIVVQNGVSALSTHAPRQLDFRNWPIVLQKSKAAVALGFGENFKREDIDDSRSLSRATEVAYEFSARR